MKRIVCIFMSVMLVAGVAVSVAGQNKDVKNDDSKETDRVLSRHSITAGLSYLRSNRPDSSPENIQLPEGIQEAELVIDIEDGEAISGTLTMPAEKDSYICVVLVHDSGPQDRDETLYSNTPFRDIAWGLAAKGIGTYRYDKRVLPGEEYPNATIDDEIVSDASEAVKVLSTRDDIESVYVLGLGLGGYMIPKISSETEDASGYIIMNGFLRTIGDIIKDQYRYMAGLDGKITEDEKTEIRMLEQDISLIEDPGSMGDREVLGASKAYWESMYSYNCIETAKTISKPVLVMQGQQDRQVPVTDYNLWKGAFGSRDNWTYRLYEGLNHLMMPVSENGAYLEYTSKGTVSQNVIDDLAQWIKK